jgi:hypothetical protein
LASQALTETDKFVYGYNFAEEIRPKSVQGSLVDWQKCFEIIQHGINLNIKR